MLDGLLFDAARRAGVEKVVFASSGCVYPNHLQADPGETINLIDTEAEVAERLTKQLNQIRKNGQSVQR